MPTTGRTYREDHYFVKARYEYSNGDYFIASGRIYKDALKNPMINGWSQRYPWSTYDGPAVGDKFNINWNYTNDLNKRGQNELGLNGNWEIIGLGGRFEGWEFKIDEYYDSESNTKSKPYHTNLVAPDPRVGRYSGFGAISGHLTAAQTELYDKISPYHEASLKHKK